MGSDGVRATGQAAAERALRSGLLALSRRRSLGRLATATPFTRPMVHRFVAGETLAEALPRLEHLTADGYRFTADLLGEAVTSRDDAYAGADGYIQTLDALARHDLERNVSVKLSQFGLAIDRDLALSNVRRVVAHADGLGGFVRIDMEDSSMTDATLEVHRAVFAEHRNVGVVMQASLRRTSSDLDDLIANGVRVRLCKGAYRESAGIAWTDRADIDHSYEALMERLLHEGTYPAFATHDEDLIRSGIAIAKRDGIARDRFEFQMLYGIRRDLQARLLKAGYNVRVYVPFGREWYAYFMRRLAERPANLAFVVLPEGRRHLRH